MYLGATNPHDTVTLSGQPDLQMTVEGGFHGDIATPAIVVNATFRVRAADLGLTTMIDLTTLSYYAMG
jgi:4-hydroxy-tetrahydrodipicolinate reductase